MLAARMMLAAAVVSDGPAAAFAADDILDAIEAGRKAYQAGDLATAKQQLDTASQLVGQKNAETFVSLLPAPLPGWTAEEGGDRGGRRRHVRRKLGEPALSRARRPRR